MSNTSLIKIFWVKLYIGTKLIKKGELDFYNSFIILIS